jgi:hypothetical protein
MKTAMQELMNYLDSDVFGICDIRDRAEKLLEKEKEQIIETYMLGFNDSYKYQIQKSNKVTPRNGEEYYNQTYNQNK